MANLKVVVPILNKRISPVENPADKSNIVGRVKMDFQFESIDEVTNTLGKWYRDRDGYYYWGGGVNEILATDNAFPDEKFSFDISRVNWSIIDYGIDKIWKYSRGENVKIAIIDTGLNNNHTNISKKKNIEYYNIFNQSINPEDCFDEEGHGTHCAGIIAAHGPEVYGVAPASDLLIIKATIKGSMECKDMASAITSAVRLGADIISLSYHFFEKDFELELVKTAVMNANNADVLIVAASGNGSSVKMPDTYPASYSTSVGVGAIDQDKNLWKDTIINYNIDILAPGHNIEAMGIGNETVFIEGTSYATPYIAGVCALLMSYARNKNPEYIRDCLKNASSSKAEIQAQIQHLYDNPILVIPDLGIVNPIEIFNQLNYKM